MALILLAACWLVPGRLKLHVIIPGYRPKLDDDMVCSGELKKCTAHLILYCTVHFTAQGGRSIEGRFLVTSPPKTAHMYVRSKITFACLRVGTKMLACLSSLAPRSLVAREPAETTRPNGSCVCMDKRVRNEFLSALGKHVDKHVTVTIFYT